MFIGRYDRKFASPLSQIEDLAVIAGNSSFDYKNKEMDVAEVRNKLNRETLLTGSVRKEHETRRFGIRLVKVSDGRIFRTREISKR